LAEFLPKVFLVILRESHLTFNSAEKIMHQWNTCDEIGPTQATISQHLKALKEMGLVKGSIEGVFCFLIGIRSGESFCFPESNLIYFFEDCKSPHIF